MANNQNPTGRQPANADAEAAKAAAAAEAEAEAKKVTPAPSQEPDKATNEDADEKIPAEDRITVETTGQFDLVSPFTGKDFFHNKKTVANKNDPFVVDQLAKGQLKEV